MILFLNDPEKLPLKPLRHHKQFQQSSRIQTQFKKSVDFLYTNSEQMEKEYRKTTPVTIA
jgi:hypothetical protein